MAQNQWLVLACIVAMTVVLTACPPQNPYEGMKGKAILVSSEGIIVGDVQLKEELNGVSINASFGHLPQGKHGFHIHQKGACEPPDFSSSGGHFNPENRKHGSLDPEGSHSGDLPNIEVDKEGQGSMSLLWYDVTLGDGPHSLFNIGGTSFIIHEKADDEITDPAGNAGKRIACGVIENID